MVERKAKSLKVALKVLIKAFYLPICTMFELQLLKTDVTAINSYKNYVIAGIGPQMLIYCIKTRKLLHKQVIFDGLRIHGITVGFNGQQMILNAEYEFTIFKCNWDTLKFDLLHKKITLEWILETKQLDDCFVTLSMHNNATFYSFANSDLTLLKKTECETKCIIYCACITNDNKNSCIALSGTVFSEVLLWRPFESGQVLHRLIGHEGVLFSIKMHLNYIATTSDDRSVILWKATDDFSDVKMEQKMFGHTGRVFTCFVTDFYVLSAGEDGFINIWDLKGNLLRKQEAHQGGTIWKLECSQRDNLIISGGSDGAINLFPLTYQIFDKKIQLPQGETPHKLALLHDNNSVIIMESGLLILHQLSSNVLQSVDVFEEFKSYALIEVSPCRRKFVLAGFNGHIFVFLTNESQELVVQLKYQLPSKSRIYSVHWLSCKHILTCTIEGLLFLWAVDCKKLVLLGAYILPKCKERWSTSACILPKIGFAVGDRKGKIYLYKFNVKDPIQIVQKAHNYLGITKLFIEDQQLISMGRNSMYKTYEISSSEEKIKELRSEKLPFSWLAGKLQNEDIIFGFSGKELTLWDLKTRKTLLNVNCGGGHRSFDLTKQRFVYLKDKCLHSVAIDLPNLKAQDLTAGLNSSEINSLLSIKNATDEILCISGGEDTVLRVFKCSLDETQSVGAYKLHLSSIRCLLLDPKGNDLYNLYSAGGRGQIIVWELSVDGHLKQIQSYYKAENEEIRVMDLQLMQTDGSKYLLAACSDGRIKVYVNLDEQLELFKVFSYKVKCILKIRLLSENTFVSMATDGLLVFWDFHKENSFFEYKIHQSGINACFVKQISEKLFLILTGGDDSQFALTAIEFSSPNGVINITDEYKNSAVHTAQITGVHLTESLILTVSLDQKLSVFQYDFQDSKLNVKFIAHYNTTICDIKGINYLSCDTYAKIVLYGLGVEVIKLVF